MKLRYVYTVTQPSSYRSLERARESFGHIQDEPGEFLLGGSIGNEDIVVKLEAQQADGTWLDVTPP